MNEDQVREALIEWESLSTNKENRALYEARMKELRDQFSNLQGERRLGREECIRMVETDCLNREWNLQK